MLVVIDNCERFLRLRFADESAAAKWQKISPPHGCGGLN
jgi:hypothetical protein